MRIIIFAAIVFFISCAEPQTETGNENTEYSSFGDSISPLGAIQSGLLLQELSGKDSVRVKVAGTIKDVCQKKGCWMTMDIGHEEPMRITFRDYSFFVPKNAAGREVIMEGIAYYDVTSVAELRHYAEDAGESPETIASITDEKVEVTFEADGVLIAE